MKNIIIIVFALLAFSCTAQTNIEEMKDFKKVSWEDLNDNVIRMIGKDWMLIAAGEENDFNMMTASWGTMGWLWGKPVSTTYVRPQRHTHNYTEKYEYYTLTFYKEEDKDILRKMGTVSGKNFDKMNYEELTPVVTENGSIAFEEAYLIIECRKMYNMVLKEDEFTDKEVMDDMYPERDFHTVYYGEIMNVWTKK